MKRIFLGVMLSLFAMVQSFADDIFTFDGITYNTETDSSCCVYTNNGKYSGDIVLPETVVFSGTTYNVLSIGYEAFGQCDGLTSVSIPNSVKIMAQRAFWGCLNLKSIKLSNSLENIGLEAFGACALLNSIEIPNSVKKIGERAFSGCM